MKLGGRESETKVQFTFETKREYWRNEYKRAKGKIFSYLMFRLKWNYYSRWRKVPRFPLNIDIEVSSACNLECDHCFRQYMDIGENELMPIEMYKKIVAECGRYKLFTLKFSMRGEPTLHPDLVEMVAYAKEKGVKEVWINTHGGNITDSLARDLMKAGPDWITVSFDGLGEMYESIRKPLKYEESIEKLKLLKRYRDEYSPGTMLNVQTLWSAVKSNPQEYIDVMKGIVDRVAYNADMNFKEIMLIPDDSYICPRLWQRLAVTSRGDVLKCPSDFEKEEIMANVSDKSIKRIWDEEQEKNRQMHLGLRKKESVVCNKCHHGAKRVKRSHKIEEDVSEGYDFKYNGRFDGVGLNRETERENHAG
ncbi:MAG: radical SAM protein [bacterium]|nr:radical SAM protein [bacterium]